MTERFRQGDLVYIDFEPSRGSEIQKRRPALVVSRDEYSIGSDFIIVCPITTSEKKRPYFLPIDHEALKPGSKVNTKQVYTLDYTPRGGRNPQFLGRVSRRVLLDAAQRLLMNFNFPF